MQSNDLHRFTPLADISLWYRDLDWRSLTAFAQTCQAFAMVFREVLSRCTKMGSFALYPRQLESANNIVHKLRQPKNVEPFSLDFEIVELQPGFGHIATLLKVAFAMCAQGGISIIGIPLSQMECWRCFIIKCFGGLIVDGLRLLCNKFDRTDIKQTDKKLLDKCVIVGSEELLECEMLGPLNDTGINFKVLIGVSIGVTYFSEKISKANTSARRIYVHNDMGLLHPCKLFPPSNVLHKSIYRPIPINLVLRVQKYSNRDGVLNQEFTSTTCRKHTIFVSHASCKGLVPSGVEVRKTSEFDLFNLAGGILIIPPRGMPDCNIHCDKVIFLLGHIGFMSTLDLLESFFENRCRSSRIEIVYYYDDADGPHPDFFMLDINCTGYKTVNRVKMIHKFTPEHLIALPKYDRFLLFGLATEEDRSYDDDLTSEMTLQDFRNYLA